MRTRIEVEQFAASFDRFIAVSLRDCSESIFLFIFYECIIFEVECEKNVPSFRSCTC